MDEYTQNLGALEDNRPAELREKDFRFEEIVSAPAPVTWVEKAPSNWKRYSIRNQDGSSSCVAQTMAKILGILRVQTDNEFVDYSAASIYNKRSNKPGEGMIGVDAWNIASKTGSAPEFMVPSQNMSEEQINAQTQTRFEDQVALLSRVANYVQFTPGDFDSVASTIHHTGKPVMVWFRFGPGEWTDVPQTLGTSVPYHHSVTAVDVTLYQGKKAIIIEDSWGKFGMFDGQRVITEEFYRARNSFAAYPIALKEGEPSLQPERPAYVPNAGPRYGQRSTEVVAVQDFLKWDGTFPRNVESTGFYGAITARAVRAFAAKYGISPSDTKGWSWGTKEVVQAQMLLA